MSGSPRVLVFTRQYPNPVLPRQGLWVQRQTLAVAARTPCVVVAPTPYCPPGRLPRAIAQFRDVPRREDSGPVEAHHPRFLSGPGLSTYWLEAGAMAIGARPTLDRLHASFRFDMIHAHFTYPDGAAAARLARRYGVPLIITEHTLWQAWLGRMALVKPQALTAARAAALHVGVSHAVRRQLVAETSRAAETRVVHIGVDGTRFTPPAEPRRGSGAEILFVGWINYLKGVDVLLRAMPRVLARRPDARLTLVGGALFRDKQRQEEELRALASTLGLDAAVHFAGPASEDGVADWMRRSDVLVLPSRRESCGAVLLEALATGLPVVATRCGGPEDLVTDNVGRLVHPEDPELLADAITDVLERRASFPPEVLRTYVLGRFGWDQLADRYLELYDEVRSAATAVGACRV